MQLSGCARKGRSPWHISLGVERRTGRNESKPLPVVMTERSHLFPSRTQQLSSPVPKVLGWTRPGRIGRCRFPLQGSRKASFFVVLVLFRSLRITGKCGSINLVVRRRSYVREAHIYCASKMCKQEAVILGNVGAGNHGFHPWGLSSKYLLCAGSVASQPFINQPVHQLHELLAFPALGNNRYHSPPLRHNDGCLPVFSICSE